MTVTVKTFVDSSNYELCYYIANILYAKRKGPTQNNI